MTRLRQIECWLTISELFLVRLSRMVLLSEVHVLFHGALVNALIPHVIVLPEMATTIRVCGIVIVLPEMATTIRVCGIVITGMTAVSPDLETVHRGEIRGVI
ncbi:hypothetical protein DPMN_010526 [Dreissena polymorpha]|uniref:Uncharacterized protein n=1 Tax=Dreissena polymorpha TaxID=45954 RepID=A0A9D4S114_DREPO|nr:hypothetical protein DPMN_010526 [Dreissena polymorpha]